MICFYIIKNIHKWVNVFCSKRLPRITWSEYFMGIAFLSAKRCEDQDNMNGACIVNNDNIIVGIGYNTLPEGCENMKSKKGIGTKMRL